MSRLATRKASTQTSILKSHVPTKEPTIPLNVRGILLKKASMVIAGEMIATTSPFHGSRFFNCPRPGKSRLNRTETTGPFHRDGGPFLGAILSPCGTGLRPRFNSVISCDLPVPMFVKRQSYQDQQQPNRRPPGPLQPNVERQRQRPGHKNPRDPRIAPTAVRPRQLWLGLPHPEQRHHREPVENPARKNKKICQLFECPA